MKITFCSSTSEVIKEVGHRIKAMRIDMSLTQRELAEKTNLSLRTISNLENGNDVSFSTVIEVLRALGLLQRVDQMIPEPGIRPSQIIELGKPRSRVRHSRGKVYKRRSWKWGDER